MDTSRATALMQITNARINEQRYTECTAPHVLTAAGPPLRTPKVGWSKRSCVEITGLALTHIACASLCHSLPLVGEFCSFSCCVSPIIQFTALRPLRHFIFRISSPAHGHAHAVVSLREQTFLSTLRGSLDVLLPVSH